MIWNLTFPIEYLDIGLVLLGAMRAKWKQSAKIMAGDFYRGVYMMYF